MRAHAAATRRRLAIGGRLDRYVLRLFGASWLVAVFLVVGIFLILDLSGNVDDFLQPGEDGEVPPASLVLRYYLYQLPFVYLQVAPLVTLMAAMFAVSKLMRHREIVAALSAGVSSRRVLAPLLAAGALLGLGMIGFRELATEAVGDLRDATYDRLKERRAERVLEDFRFKDEAGHPVFLGEFRAGSEPGDTPHVRGLFAIVRSPDSFLRIEADEAHWVPEEEEGGRWELVNGRRTFVDDSEQRQTPIEVLEDIAFTPRDVLVLVKAEESPFDVSGSEARFLAQRDPDNVQYRTLTQYHLSFPLANLVLLLVGLPFLLHFRRGRGPEGAVGGFLLCVFYFATDVFTRSLGMDGQLGPLLATWLPVLLFGSLGVVLYAGMRS